MMINNIAQTNVQLYNQLRVAGYTIDELSLVDRAYRLSISLYSAFFQANGKPFVCHTTGVASIMAHLRLPAHLVAAACVHNVYNNGDFGDGLKNAVTANRRHQIRAELGEEIEAYVYRFNHFRLNQQTLPAIMSGLDTLGSMDRNLILMYLADILEKYADFSIAYTNKSKHGTAKIINEFSADVYNLAQRLGYPQLAEALSTSILHSSKESIPDILVSERSYAKQIMPKSAWLRPLLATRRLLKRLPGRISRLKPL